MNEVMERLRAADPVSGEISQEDRHTADDLLARIVGTPPEQVAEPLAPARRRGLPRAAFAVAGLACAVLAALAAIDLAGSDAPSTAGAVDKAIAATSRPNTIYHVVERTTFRGLGFGPPQTIYVESWHTTNGHFRRKSFLPGADGPGRLADETAGRRRPGRRGGPALRYEARQNEIYPSGMGFGSPQNSVAIDPFAGPGLQLRQLRREGRLQVSGTTELDGKSAIRLVSDWAPGIGDTRQRSEYLVDAKSYLPLRLRQRIELKNGKRGEIVYRYLTYERLPLNSKTRGLLALGDHPGAKCVGDFRRITRQRDAGFPHRCTR